MPLLKNQIVPLTIDTLSSDGNGVGRFDGMAVFVPFTAIGDVLEVRIVKVCKSYAFGIIARIAAPGAGRIPADCAIFGKCGGCCFWHLSYTTELQAKQGFVENAMQRIGGLALPVQKILPSPQPKRYRNKVQYPLFRADDGNVRTGFYASRSHRPVPCADCLLQPRLLNQIADTVCELLTQYGISVYDERTHRGLARHLYLRHAAATNRALVCLVCNGRRLPHAEEFCAALCAAHPEVESVVLNVNTQQTNVVTGTQCVPLFGPGVLRDTLRGVPVVLDPLSFYQVNTEGADRLYGVAAALAAPGPSDTLLDLYCGAGAIGLSMAAQCKRLIGVEIVPEAAENARRAATEMGLSHAEFLCADAGAAAAKLAADGLLPDIVILDPPRKGCSTDTLNAVLRMAPRRIVMISCNPATAARDIKYLAAQGYAAEVIQPVDLFPRTKHVETVVLLSHKNPTT